MTLVIAGDFDMKNIKQRGEYLFWDFFESYPLKNQKNKRIGSGKTRIDVKNRHFRRIYFILLGVYQMPGTKIFPHWMFCHDFGSRG